MARLVADLLGLAARLVDVESVSHHEQELADLVEEQLRAVDSLEVVRVEDNVVARTSLGRSRRVALAGHLDTVPPAGNDRARIEGDTLHGLGSADMKGGLAVMLELARTVTVPSADVTYIF
ncbi:MAG: M20/M25/M40 family metallo-hydrolase, partial [Acidimicrobiales bacterium]